MPTGDPKFINHPNYTHGIRDGIDPNILKMMKEGKITHMSYPYITNSCSCSSLENLHKEDKLVERNIKEYILVFLGAPCVNVNLTDKQINMAIESATITVNGYLDPNHGLYDHCLRSLSLCNAKQILGRVNFESSSIKLQRVGAKLLEEAHSEKLDFLSMFRNSRQ